MAGVQCLLGSLHHSVHADLGDDDLHLDLGQQGGIHRHAAVLFGSALLDAAAHHLSDGHAGNAQIVEGSLELIELGKLCNDGHLVHTGVVHAIVDHGRRLAHHRNGSADLLVGGLGHIVLAEVGVLVGHHGSRVCIGDGETSVSGCQTMLVDIQTVDLHLCGNAQADELIDELEDNEHHNDNVDVNGNEAQQLGAQLCQTAAVEETCVLSVGTGGEQAHRNGAPHAVCKVDGNCTNRVIHLGDVIEELNAQNNEQAGHKADEECAERRNGIAACSDRHQTGQRTVQGHGNIGLAVAQPGEDHSHTGGNGCGKVGVEADQTGHGHGLVGGKAQRRTAVEAEPAEPQDEHAQSTGGQVVAGNGVRLAVLVVLADAGTQHPCAQQSDDTAHIVDCCRACKIMEAHALQPAAAPHPVAADGVDHQRDRSRINAVSLEVGALGHGAGNDGGGRCAEHGLEHDVDPQRDIQTQMAVIALNERVEAADQCAGAAEHQAKADDPVARSADAEVHHILHQNITGVLGTGETGFAQGEARLHEVDKERCNQRPTGVDGAEHNFSYLPRM